MRKFLSVEVEHTRHARFLPLDQPGENKISLTTLADFQKRAEVKIFLISNDQRILLHVFEVDRLPKKQAGEPRLVLKGRYDGKGNVRLSINVDGRHYSSASISVKKYTRERVWWPWVLLIALLLLGASAWLLLRSCNTAGALLGSSGPEPAPLATAEKEPEAADSEPAAADTGPEAQPQTVIESGGSSPSTQDAPQSSSDTETQTEAEAEAEAESATPAPEQEQRSQAQPRASAAVDLSEQVYFGPDSSDLSPEARRTLAAFAEELERYDQPRLRIEGHCALYGTEQGREELSYDRAQRVFQYFRELGYGFEEEPLVRGRGGEAPVTRESDQQYQNRRVEITTVLPDNNNSGRQDR